MRRRKITVNEIINIVIDECPDMATMDEVKGKSRKPNIIFVRHLSIRMSKIFTSLTLTRIGSIFNRDHTTVIHSIEKTCDYFDTDKKYREVFNRIFERINSEQFTSSVFKKRARKSNFIIYWKYKRRIKNRKGYRQN